MARISENNNTVEKKLGGVSDFQIQFKFNTNVTFHNMSQISPCSFLVRFLKLNLSL